MIKKLSLNFDTIVWNASTFFSVVSDKMTFKDPQ